MHPMPDRGLVTEQGSSLIDDSYRYRVIGWMLRHPSRLTYVIAEFSRPLSIGLKLDNAWFHVRHWNDVDAWRSRLEGSGFDDSCT